MLLRSTTNGEIVGKGCHCVDYTVKLRLRARFYRGTVPLVCKQKVVIRYYNKKIKEELYLCRKHYDELCNHRVCIFCNYFPSQDSKQLSCGHFTHERCALRKFRTNSQGLVCSHCDEQVFDKEDDEDINRNTLSFTPSDSCLDEKSANSDSSIVDPKPDLTNLNESPSSFPLSYRVNNKLTKTIFDYLVTNKPLKTLETFLRFRIDCETSEIPGWSTGEMLSQLVSEGLYEAVNCVRGFCAPVSPSLLFLCLDRNDHNMLPNLKLDPSFSEIFLSHRNKDNDTIVSAAIRKEAWDFLRTILRHFEKRGIDVNSATGDDGKTVVQLAESAPSDIKSDIRSVSLIESTLKMMQFDKKIVIPDLAHGCERFPVRVVNDVDNLLPDAFHYATRVVDHENILRNRRTDETLFCECKDECTLDCSCNSEVYDERGKARVERLDGPFLECGSDCRCSMKCGNRIAQKGSKHAIEVFRCSDRRGWGVRALSRIQKGSFLGEYTGELLSDGEANKRIDSYLFETTVGDGTFTVDARLYGNFTRFMNHSCDPNAKVCMVVWDWQADQLNHICIFAVKDIMKGEEITISYGEHWWRSKIHEFSCLCNKPKCAFNEVARAATMRNSQGGASSVGESTCSDDSEGHP